MPGSLIKISAVGTNNSVHHVLYAHEIDEHVHDHGDETQQGQHDLLVENRQKL